MIEAEKLLDRYENDSCGMSARDLILGILRIFDTEV
jgi:hypothetical protein